MAERVKATDVAAADVAAAAPREERPEPGVGPAAPAERTAEGGGPEGHGGDQGGGDGGHGDPTGPAGGGCRDGAGRRGAGGWEFGGHERSGASIGARPSPALTMRAVPVAGPPPGRAPRSPSAPWPRRPRRGTPPIHSSAPLRRVWWAETQPGPTLARPGVIRRLFMVPRGVSELSAPRSVNTRVAALRAASTASAGFRPVCPDCYPDPAFGGIAQLVERLTGSQEVRGSNPLTSTKVSIFEPRTCCGPGFVALSAKHVRNSTSWNAANGCAIRA